MCCIFKGDADHLLRVSAFGGLTLPSAGCVSVVPMGAYDCPVRQSALGMGLCKCLSTRRSGHDSLWVDGTDLYASMLYM